MGIINKYLKSFFVLALTLMAINGKSQNIEAPIKPYRIGVLLPFTAAANEDGNINKQEQLISYAMMDFYGGIKLALENLSSLGFNAEIYTWNTQGKPIDDITALFKSQQFDSLDLVIGPIDDELALEISKIHPSLIQVSPLKYLKNNPQSINFFQKKENRFESVIEGVFNRFQNYRVCVISKNPNQSKITVEKLSKSYNNKFTVTYHSYSQGSISPNLPSGDNIILVIDGIAQTQKLRLTRKINRKVNSYIIADHTWFDNFLPAEEVDESLIIYPTINHIFGLDPITQEFSKQYIDSFHAEPSRFGYQGYDQMWFLGNALLTFGNDFINYLPNAEYSGIINNIALKHTDLGLINRGMRFLYRKESELISWD